MASGAFARAEERSHIAAGAPACESNKASRAVILIDDSGQKWLGHAVAIDNEHIVYGLHGTDEQWSVDRKSNVITSLQAGETDQCRSIK